MGKSGWFPVDFLVSGENFPFFVNPLTWGWTYLKYMGNIWKYMGKIDDAWGVPVILLRFNMVEPPASPTSKSEIGFGKYMEI